MLPVSLFFDCQKPKEVVYSNSVYHIIILSLTFKVCPVASRWSQTALPGVTKIALYHVKSLGLFFFILLHLAYIDILKPLKPGRYLNMLSFPFIIHI